VILYSSDLFPGKIKSNRSSRRLTLTLRERKQLPMTVPAADSERGRNVEIPIMLPSDKARTGISCEILDGTIWKYDCMRQNSTGIMGMQYRKGIDNCKSELDTEPHISHLGSSFPERILWDWPAFKINNLARGGTHLKSTFPHQLLLPLYN
jgi:hypothetical protein